MAQTISIESKNSKPKVKPNFVKVACGSEIELIHVTKTSRPQPVRINPESEEERLQRLAKRKAATLKAFQATYNHQNKR